MARDIENLKAKLVEALGFAGVPNEVFAQVDQVFAEHAPAQKRARKVKRSPRKTAPASKRRTTKRSKKKR